MWTTKNLSQEKKQSKRRVMEWSQKNEGSKRYPLGSKKERRSSVLLRIDHVKSQSFGAEKKGRDNYWGET